mmetsp:Transcript_21359/g.43106  ORF Transcript_21359/g.43106 Transcript_21359/m.43106 type:complete len:323 (-) Transcript_21359:135-1103(-)|eukprot:CAMPEP_0183300650 /NCGR_PEP_ID=MMETSP0160_2-20130417/6998_1 /TAXON_ID=2839 ORGANISM="Odontella Sinensis, Strain Grunow 1884" /NCGR_SAMPLE_ID=MMETSP0160_2 /ASSEMBLY_ACC=CAM_ASM_000250 /LENGTH=322 /DNA_ID=CAMNT_0025463103 /DNA_START=137 /DNA_END=1105 /DNA_ORIENTATION=-
MFLRSARSAHTILLLLISTFGESSAQLGFDIYGDAGKFDPKHFVTLDKESCEYIAEVQFNALKANLPFPPVMPGPDGPGSCTIEDASCEGQSCLYEIRNSYHFDKYFQKVTGFNHVGFDWSPCGHPPLENFGRPHLNLHIFRISTETRESLTCDMLNPFICKFPPTDIQSTISGKKYFIVGKEAESGLIVNAPATHTYDLDSAVPGEGLHAWDHAEAAPVGDWINPLLITGLYGGGNNFWEPMFPYEFVSGDVENFYDESPEYVSQTIISLPSYWSMHYNPTSGVTTLIMKGTAENCAAKSSKTSKRKKAKKIKKYGKRGLI